ncbi:MAG: RNA polymerase sigma factor SigJ [Gammaproteobacteria bacterium]
MSDTTTAAAGADARPPGMDERAQRYAAEHARPLRALAYRMLGSRADAEDVVQEAWLRWSTAIDATAIRHPREYLSRIVTRLCLDRLGAAAARREQYVGLWLPEPLLDDERADWCPERQTALAQDVSMAFLLALERLSPLERAAFLLHEVFELGFDEVAQHLARSPAACRQLASRARAHLRAGEARRSVSAAERERLGAAFVRALRDRDVDALTRALTADATLLADGGGRVTAISRALHGGPAVARLLVAFADLPAAAAWRLQPVGVGGEPGYLVVDEQAGVLVQVVALIPAADGTQVTGIHVQRNPDKLRAVAATLGLDLMHRDPGGASHA